MKGFFPVFLPALLISFGTAVSLGFSRFDYALILPSMMERLGWSYSEAGWLNTANSIGYLAGAAGTGRIIARFPVRTLFLGGLVLTSVSVLASGLVVSYPFLFLFRLAAGIFGALSFIAGSVLVASLFPQDSRRSGTALSLYTGGGGFGILVSGLFLPLLFAKYGAEFWPRAWLALGVAGLLLTWISSAASGGPELVPEDPVDSASWDPRSFVPALGGYFLFGIGYLIYMTYFIKWVEDKGAGPGMTAVVWGVLGLSVILSPLFWKGMLSRHSGGRSIGLSIGLTSLGALIPLISRSLLAMLLSALIFGFAFLNVPAAVTAMLRASLPRTAWGIAITFFTVVFALGQIVGPVLGGVISDWTGSLSSGLALSVLALAGGAIVSLFQRG
ncbi:MAG: YbfB/YjiJ family MFS transporter [Nitrospirae bacterium]|jgi:MFS family permease|nr:YbfB/YjiJ family MFS transporter [Nitrospirota bacterium]